MLRDSEDLDRDYVDRGLPALTVSAPGPREVLAASRPGDTLGSPSSAGSPRSVPDERDIVDELTRGVHLDLGGSTASRTACTTCSPPRAAQD